MMGLMDSPPMPLDQALPRELLVLAIAHHLPQKSDVRRLSLTSRFFFSLVSSPELVAAWLWRRHGNDAMRIAMHNDDMAVFRQLVEVQRADVNALLYDGLSRLLHVASSLGLLEYVTYLLGVPGIEVNLRESIIGKTALHTACCRRHQAIVHKLLQHPAIDVNSMDNEGYTALHAACEQDCPEVVAELLGHPGVDVNKTSGPFSSTALHLACFKSRASVVRELLKHPDLRVNQKSVRRDGREGDSALRCCFSEAVLYCFFKTFKTDANLATLKELLKHPGLDRGDMKAALQMAQAHSRLNRYAEAIAEAL